MILPFESLLVLGAVGIYVFDSSVLMCANEMMIVCKRRSREIALPNSRFELLRKFPYIPNPFTPHIGLIKTIWYPTVTSANGYDNATLAELQACLRPVGAATVSLLAMLLIALPFALFVARTQLSFLILLAVIYMHVFFILTVVFARRHKLRLEKWAFAKLAFDSLACAPLAVNVVRKIYLRQSLCNNTLAVVADICGRDAVVGIAPKLLFSVDEMLEHAEENNAEKASLEQFKSALQKFKK